MTKPKAPKYATLNPVEENLNPLFSPSPNLPSLFWDVDDIILNSSETILNLLHSPVSLHDIKDYQYRSIDRTMTPERLESIFASPAFWSQVRVNPLFIEYLTSITSTHFNNYILTHGSEENLTQKSILFSRLAPNFGQILLPLSTPKSALDLTNSIQIDDHIDNLSTNATIKILVKNLRETNYNGGLFSSPYNRENFYVLPDLTSLLHTLDFFATPSGRKFITNVPM